MPPSGAPTAAGNGIGGCVDLSGALSGSGWEDSFGDGCLKFEGSPEWCEYYGDEDANGEGTAKQVRASPHLLHVVSPHFTSLHLFSPHFTSPPVLTSLISINDSQAVG